MPNSFSNAYYYYLSFVFTHVLRWLEWIRRYQTPAGEETQSRRKEDTGCYCSDRKIGSKRFLTQAARMELKAKNHQKESMLSIKPRKQPKVNLFWSRFKLIPQLMLLTLNLWDLKHKLLLLIKNRGQWKKTGMIGPKQWSTPNIN